MVSWEGVLRAFVKFSKESMPHTEPNQISNYLHCQFHILTREKQERWKLWSWGIGDKRSWGWGSRIPQPHPDGRVTLVPSMGHHPSIDGTRNLSLDGGSGLAPVFSCVSFAATEPFLLKIISDTFSPSSPAAPPWIHSWVGGRRCPSPPPTLLGGFLEDSSNFFVFNQNIFMWQNT